MLSCIVILKAANVWERKKGDANLSPPYQIKRTRSQAEPEGCGSNCRGYSVLQKCPLQVAIDLYVVPGANRN